MTPVARNVFLAATLLAGSYALVAYDTRGVSSSINSATGLDNGSTAKPAGTASSPLPLQPAVK